jgi:fructoselysine-6-phosphate deglycase
VLDFDEERYVRIQRGAVDLAGPLHEAVSAALAAGADNLFLLGTGGAGILLQPAARLLQQRSTFPVFWDLPAELLAQGSVHLGPRSLVVLASLSGTTPETVEVLGLCRERGATVLALVGHDGTPLAEQADSAFVNFAEDDTSCESFYLQSLLVALSVLAARGELDDHAGTVAELQLLPELLLDVKRQAEGRAPALAQQLADEPFHIVTGAGSTWPQAWYYGMCILEEMQWIRTRPVHASDFFHGTLELVEEGVSVLLLKGEDGSRSLVERVEKFLPGRTDRVAVLDTAELPLPGISSATRALVSPVLLAAVLERVSAHLQVLRDHPLTTRRYYKRVAY